MLAQRLPPTSRARQPMPAPWRTDQATEIPSPKVDRPGTFGTGLKSQRLDYLILSPTLQEELQAVGIDRRGPTAHGCGNLSIR